jgi:hypothetical protein
MKRYLIILFFTILSSNIYAQWQWAKQIGGPSNDFGSALIDPNNNIFISGYFSNTCFFDNDTLQSLGMNDLFLAKYDNTGNEIWTKKIGSYNNINFEYPGGFIIDRTNSFIYYSGSFFNSLTIDSHSLLSKGESDIFLAKFDFSGNCIWLKSIGSVTFDSPGVVSMDSSGSIYWTGELDGVGTIDTTTVTPGTFLAKLDSNGNVIWIRREIINGNASELSITNSNIFISGYTTNISSTIDTAVLLSSNNIDVFISKLDLLGNVIWAKRFGGNLDDFPANFELDLSQNIYLTGTFKDSLKIGNTIITNNGKNDMFFTKLDNNGGLIWVKQCQANGATGAGCNSIDIDADDNFYLAGHFSGAALFDIINVNSISTNDFFLAKYDSSGKCIGVRNFGSVENGAGQVDNSNNIIVFGNFNSSAVIGNKTLITHGASDMFIAKATNITGIGGGLERHANNQLIIYANPTAGKCNITVPDDFLHEKNLTLSIYANDGKLIQQKNLQTSPLGGQGAIRLNLEAEAKGIYNVTLSNGVKNYSGKIVFE